MGILIEVIETILGSLNRYDALRAMISLVGIVSIIVRS